MFNPYYAILHRFYTQVLSVRETPHFPGGIVVAESGERINVELRNSFVSRRIPALSGAVQSEWQSVCVSSIPMEKKKNNNIEKREKCDCGSYVPPLLKPVISEIDLCDL